jgi:post-segregation antitoxin (ccd killing protein)
MGLRDLYNQFEKAVTPIANQVIATEEFAKAAALATAVNKVVRKEAEKLQARAWHAVNLPAGTDVQRLKQQVGSLDRELRLIAMELERERREAKRRGDAGPEHD